MRGRERGSALLTVLLIVGVIGAMAAIVLDRLRMSTHLTANSAALDQARAYALAAEAVAASRIEELNGRASGRTTLAGGWNGTARTMPLPGGFATVRVRDGGNCFNLNSVAQGEAATGLVVRPSGVAQFNGLMDAIDIPERQARRISAALADWVDSDAAPVAHGAEDAAYARAPSPYRTANMMVADVSELRAVTGMTPALYARLRPWVCALPTTQLSEVNVNTLTPDQAPLVAMLIPGMGLEAARSIIAARPAEGWNSVSQFWKLPALAALTPSMDVQSQASVATRWFGLDLAIEIGGAELRERALIDAGVSPARLVSRSWGDDA
jgi:general secretion pathway protein K